MCYLDCVIDELRVRSQMRLVDSSEENNPGCEENSAE